MWNLYIVKKWIIDVHGATKGHLSPGDEPLQNPPSSMMFPWINAHLQHARWFASHVWWQSGYIGYISWSPKFQFFILFLHDYSNLHGHPHGWLLNPMKSPRKSQFFMVKLPWEILWKSQCFSSTICIAWPRHRALPSLDPGSQMGTKCWWLGDGKHGIVLPTLNHFFNPNNILACDRL